VRTAKAALSESEFAGSCWAALIILFIRLKLF
jgi:hypothetical protein